MKIKFTNVEDGLPLTDLKSLSKNNSSRKDFVECLVHNGKSVFQSVYREKEGFIHHGVKGWIYLSDIIPEGFDRLYDLEIGKYIFVPENKGYQAFIDGVTNGNYVDALLSSKKILKPEDHLPKQESNHEKHEASDGKLVGVENIIQGMKDKHEASNDCCHGSDGIVESSIGVQKEDVSETPKYKPQTPADYLNDDGSEKPLEGPFEQRNALFKLWRMDGTLEKFYKEIEEKKKDSFISGGTTDPNGLFKEKSEVYRKSDGKWFRFFKYIGGEDVHGKDCILLAEKGGGGFTVASSKDFTSIPPEKEKPFEKGELLYF